jgi:molybdopterin synthase catalytic subunit
MTIKITQDIFNAWESLAAYEKTNIPMDKSGAVTTFIGRMRDNNIGDNVQKMFLEYYPQMTEKYLEKISQEAKKRWNIIDSLIVHRVGNILPSETIVLVAVWSGHRKEAFTACKFLIEELKHNAPFWKKELLNNLDDNYRWVAENTTG